MSEDGGPDGQRGVTSGGDPWRAPDQRPPAPYPDWSRPAPPPVPPQAPVPGPPPYSGFGVHRAAPTPERAGGRLPGWAWPTIAATALVLGLLGGLIGGALVGGDDEGTVPGGVLRVERRTAAPLEADNGSVPAVAQAVLPSTVQIIAEYDGAAEGATGSGFVLDREGHVITNNHVVAEAASDGGPIAVVDSKGRRTSAEVIGRSAVYDVAVLKVDAAKSLTPAALGSSTQMRVGETVVAFGAPLGLTSSVTSGIVSALNRPVSTGSTSDDQSYINAVQTDAAINPGNSGGPLVDLQGKVVGMNSAIASLGQGTGDQGGNIGVGFAIPVEQVVTTVDQILKSGSARYPVIGAGVVATRGSDEGAELSTISDGDPADDAGLQSGDVVTRVDGKPVTSPIDLVVAIRSHVSGDKLRLSVERGGSSRDVSVTLTSRREKVS
ncbi:hypothetical protein GCM10011519_28850 [Marmoricola endophyticus]|uniref:PDZ domain-containing protein n=1 Tax=Marmoricola endophyticus TaxID=2040280 RepID=A0A917BNN3_9ACTN|nr:trypsin-like peptidase domain-containing protein [Marmoricola endophyticus]GGF53148.1 hypothetical protein GCM10011519_28850 [Marmoricola endophyticus]